MTPSEEFVLIYLTESEGWPEEWVTYRGNEMNLGYDIEIKDPSGRVFRAIEVKMPLGHGVTIHLRPSQKTRAIELGGSFWLYVVEKDPFWRVMKILRNPMLTLSLRRGYKGLGLVYDLQPPQRLIGL